MNDALAVKAILDELDAQRERPEPVDPASLGISAQGYSDAPVSAFRPSAVLAAAQEQRQRENPYDPTPGEQAAELHESYIELEAAGLRVPSALAPALIALDDSPAAPQPTTKRRGLLARLLRIT
jgi:hypothetical protein